MMATPDKKDLLAGTWLAILATVIWSGNFIIARFAHDQIGPVSLAFFRWFTATLILVPFAWRKTREEWPFIRKHGKYLFWVAITGITLFNTLVYIAGHYTTAINMALIGTTSSPVFATILAVLFLKEKISAFRVWGMILCFAGILLLLSKGSLHTLAGFRFSTGDLWILLGALAFAVYSILVRKKPTDISSLVFLWVVFGLGTLMLFPFFIAESYVGVRTNWSYPLLGMILYLGAGTSVIAFFCWNRSIQKMGASRTVLFGNLIPVFSTLEAVWLLDEKISFVQILSGFLVIAGLLLANIRTTKNS
ncbi:MAG: DMT family transporter [Bacteroidota bacterium]|nr:DMT family transporter [Bacteroidota bacterium]